MFLFFRSNVLRSLRLVPLLLLLATFPGAAAERWSEAKANTWYRERGWLVGCNYSPHTAINQLEMWQADTFDTAVIDRELAWAQQLGFNSVRVFLHDLLWERDGRDFLRRIDRFLQIAERHRIGVMFVLLDGVWDPFPKLGRQREPKPHVHNSGWVQSPGVEILKNPQRHAILEPYIKGVVGKFRNDRRVHAWDLFNEPDNMNRPAYEKHEPTNKPELALALLRKVFEWTREINPKQPLTAGVWLGNWGDTNKLSAMEKFMLEESDIITFHNYGPIDDITRCVQNLRRYGRPILCTEYMARPRGSTFDPILAFLKRENVAAYNWGFVDGKTQTIYPWDTWRTNYTQAPQVWFHDILRSDGTPFNQTEVNYIRSVTRPRTVRSRN